jgi:hypothetical protein
LIDPVQEAAAAILQYLIAHQDARDTVEGIEKWWLPQSRQYGIGDVAAALAILENRNLIRVWKSAAAKPVYGRGSADSHYLDDYLRSIE